MYENIKTAITAAGFVPVRLPANQKCSSYSLWTEDGAIWERSFAADGTGSIKVTGDGTKGMAININQQYGASIPGTIVCYAKGTSSTNLVGIITV